MISIKPITFAIYTIGCKTNQAESDDIAGQLVLAGCHQAEISDVIADAAGDSFSSHDGCAIDYIIINTCTVTAAADRKAKHLVRKLKSASPKSKLIITGCFAELNREMLKDISADYIFSNNKKNEIADFICNDGHAGTETDPGKESAIAAASGLPEETRQSARFDLASEAPKTEETAGDLIFKSLSAESVTTPAVTSAFIPGTTDAMPKPMRVHSRAFVKIQDGCQQGCSYCIVPRVRGPYLSTDASKVIYDIKKLVLLGHDEIVLTGIHIGKFGVDLLAKKDTVKSLSGLVLEILKNTTVKRLRISSIEINEIDESLIDVMRNEGPRLAPHLHVPLQSGSDNVLKAMNRRYDRNFFISAIEHIKKEIPSITITTDVIVGFPGETEQDFAKTLEISGNINFSKIHVFKYSIRPGTRAADMPGHLQEKTKTERSRILRELGLDLRNGFLTSNMGKKLDVVCEEYDMKSGIAGGTSENYIKVYFDLNFEEYKLKKGRILKVCAESLYADGLYGEVI